MFLDVFRMHLSFKLILHIPSYMFCLDRIFTYFLYFILKIISRVKANPDFIPRTKVSLLSCLPHLLIFSFHNVSDQLSFISFYYVSIPSQL